MVDVLSVMRTSSIASLTTATASFATHFSRANVSMPISATFRPIIWGFYVATLSPTCFVYLLVITSSFGPKTALRGSPRVRGSCNYRSLHAGALNGGRVPKPSPDGRP
jgi:hypothetical protein